MLCLTLPSFQIVMSFWLLRLIDFVMNLNIKFVSIHSKVYESKKAKTTYNLGWWDIYPISCISCSYRVVGESTVVQS